MNEENANEATEVCRHCDGTGRMEPVIVTGWEPDTVPCYCRGAGKPTPAPRVT